MSKKITKLFIIFAIVATSCVFAFYSLAKPGNFFYSKKHKDSGHSEKKLDLKVSSVCHYFQNGIDVGCENNGVSFGNWEATDLGTAHKFFNFPDLKPGDSGEDTIDLTVKGGDACGQMTIEDVRDFGNTCTEPETEMRIDRDCRHRRPGCKEKDGEMRENLELRLWLDQGDILGFQGKSEDLLEGDNVFNGKDALMMDWTSLERCPKTYELRKFLRTDRQRFWGDCHAADSDGDGQKCKNKVCNGVARDGRLLEGVTYYIGFAWRLPDDTGNEAQTDSLKFNLRFTARDNASCSPCQNSCEKCHDSCRD